MSQFLETASKILKKEGKPLSAKEITEKGIQLEYLVTSGKTPWQTMKSKLSKDILTRREESNFMRTSKGKFGLREWKTDKDTEEYHADRFKKRPLEEDVIVFPAALIDEYVSEPGLSTMPISKHSNLLDQCRGMSRIEAEKDYSVIQLISVFIIHYKDLYLTYKRVRRLPEKRLHGAYSLFFGGHLNPEDLLERLPVSIFEPEVNKSLFLVERELSEELILPPDEAPDILYKGLLYDTSREVSQQHLGIVYDVYLKTASFKIGERGFLMQPKFESLEEIEDRLDQFENWSVVIFSHEKKNRMQV